MAAAAGAAAAEEGMEPRALQYEQTLVSEASRALRSVLPDRCSWLPVEARGRGRGRGGGATLSPPQPSELGKLRLEGLRAWS